MQEKIGHLSSAYLLMEWQIHSKVQIWNGECFLGEQIQGQDHKMYKMFFSPTKAKVYTAPADLYVPS